MSYIIGSDLGKRRNPATIAIGLPTKVLQGGPPAGGGMMIGHAEEIVYTEVHIPRLEEFTLGTPYREIVARYDQINQHVEFARNCEFVIDATGVGEAVMEMTREKIHEAIGVYSTGGVRSRKDADTNDYMVPKGELAMALMLWYESGRIRINEGHDRTFEGRRQREMFKKYDDQLAKFREEITASHNKVYGADEEDGEHFDLVMAVCLVCWRANQLYGIERPQAPDEAFPEATDVDDSYDPFSMLQGSQ